MNVSSNESEEYGYDYEYYDQACDKGGVVQFGSIVIPVFFSIVIALSLLGNSLVLVILALYENLKSLTNIFILNLAISDLVFTAGLPFWAIDHIWGWVLPRKLCNIVNFIFYTGFYSSVLFLTVMTIHRYVAVVHPLSDHVTRKRVGYGATVSTVLWVVSIGAAMPSLLFSSVIELHHKKDVSWGCEIPRNSLWKRVGTYQQNIFFLVAFVVMAFCYIQILARISRTKYHMKNKTVKLIFSIVAVFFFGWMPYNVVIFLQMLDDYYLHEVPPFTGCEVSDGLDYAFYVCRLIAFSHCCLNPVFYAFVGVKFRSHLKSIILQMSLRFHRQSPVVKPGVRTANIHSNGSMY